MSEARRQRAGEIATEIGADLARVLVGAELVTDDSVASTVAAWPWSVLEDGVARPMQGSPERWEHVESADRMKICVTANLVHFSRPGPGLLFLDPEAPLWRVDLALYPKIIGDLFGFSADNGDQRFGLVAEDGAAGGPVVEPVARERERRGNPRAQLLGL